MIAELGDNLALASLALAIEATAGYPQAVLRAIGHPVIWIGAMIARADQRLNREDWPPAARRLAGVAAIAIVAGVCFAAGWLLQEAALAAPFGIVLLAILTSSLFAQRSLHAHVADVAQSLDISLDQGRESVARIVGRDVSRLDAAGVSRAAIESLAENFSDGIVAPAVFTVLFGLPGALIYKSVNTADSMIGHKTMRYAAFGWASARLDDLLNLPAARLTAGLIALSAATRGASFRAALSTCRRDARKHASPNAGWPEAAMAGALGLRLGGPRAYGARQVDGARLAADGARLEVDGAWLGSGRSDAGPADIRRALQIYRRAAVLLWLSIGGATLLLLVFRAG